MQIKILTVLLFVGFCFAPDNRKNLTTSPANYIKTFTYIEELQNRTLQLHYFAKAIYAAYFDNYTGDVPKYAEKRAMQNMHRLIGCGENQIEAIRLLAEQIGTDIISDCLDVEQDRFKDAMVKVLEAEMNCTNQEINKTRNIFDTTLRKYHQEFKDVASLKDFLKPCNESWRSNMSLTYFSQYDNDCVAREQAKAENFYKINAPRIKHRLQNVTHLLNELEERVAICINGDKLKPYIEDDVDDIAKCAAIFTGKNIFDSFRYTIQYKI